MNTPNILNKIELSFWNRAIPLMTESRMVQSLVRKTYLYAKEPRRASWIPAAILASAGLGLGLGIILGSFQLYLR
jgi:hypothetical protein